MGVDYRGHVEFLRQVIYETVDEDGCVRVETGIRLVAEKIFRIQGYCTGYSYPFLHSAAEFIGIFVIRSDYIDLLEAVLCPFPSLGCRPVGEEFHREHDVLDHCSEIEEGASLEEYSDILSESLPFFVTHL